MSSKSKGTIVTPSEQILDDEVVEVEFPQWDGQRGILTGAAPFVGRLGTGRLRIRYEQGAEKNFLLAGGFAEMHDNRLVLVADEIVPVTEIDAAAAKTRFDAAVAAIAEPGTHSPEARERLEHERQVAAAALSLAGSAVPSPPCSAVPPSAISCSGSPPPRCFSG